VTGYFSQLAHHTGLSFAPPGATMTGNGIATQFPIAGQPAESAPPASPEIEEIVFAAAAAAPAPAPINGNSESLVGASSVGANSLPDRESAAAATTDGDDHPRSVPEAKRLIDVSSDTSWEESRIAFTESQSATREPREHSAEEQAPEGERRMVSPGERSGVERRPHRRESTEITAESIEAAEIRFATQGERPRGRHAPRSEAKESDPPQPTSLGEAANAVRDEPLVRKMIAHRYLNEVKAWVAAPQTFDHREAERQRDAQRPPAGHREVFDLEPQLEPTTALQSARPEALEVQDLNLSIGTISIVIEEPAQAAPAAPPVPPRSDRALERPASEPTRLSRYYLARW
jgi:hypothetical protein